MIPVKNSVNPHAICKPWLTQVTWLMWLQNKICSILSMILCWMHWSLGCLFKALWRLTMKPSKLCIAGNLPVTSGLPTHMASNTERGSHQKMCFDFVHQEIYHWIYNITYWKLWVKYIIYHLIQTNKTEYIRYLLRLEFQSDLPGANELKDQDG